MALLRSLRVAAPAFIAAIVGTTVWTPAAGATPEDRQLFTWTGRVDREVYITMRGREVRTSGIDAGMPNRAGVNEALPRGRGDVAVHLVDGRGDAMVVEQPSARNGFTTTIRVSDPRGGADSYRVVAYWTGDDRYGDDRYDRDCASAGNGRGWGWRWGLGRGPRDRDCDDRAGRGIRDRDRDDRDRDDRDRDDRDRDDRDRDDRGRDGRGVWGDRERSGSGVLRWSGRVDDVVEIRVSGRRVETVTRSGRRVEDVNSTLRGGGLPDRELTLVVDRHRGRGRVDVVQQPSGWNAYTAVIRIHDPRGGASHYDFSAYWN